ncbi:MAG: divalent-cation tolerance protein CutA [Desulfovibrio sp.]|nr:divalent-cation tolerance protein CutA [Desulfovibrio sp.]
MNGQYIIVSTTFADKAEAEKCIAVLLDKRIVACCQISEIESIYRWHGNIERSKEYKVEIKSTKKLFSKIKETIIAKSSYDVPEIVAYDIIEGSEEYLQWIDTETE